MINQNPQQPQIDIKSTTSLKNSEDGVVFQQGVLLRQLSKFIAGTPEDALIPIPVFFDGKTGKLVQSSIPADLREELKDY